jgi:hypothetical protein
VTKIFDVAVSFAGEQRQYVEAVVEGCKLRGIEVFYDKDMSNDWWGKNFLREQRKVCGSRARYFVPFLSTEYLAKPIPGDEFSAAMMTAAKLGDGYILPVLMGNVQVPADLLHPHIGYLRSEDYTPDQLARSQLRSDRLCADGGRPGTVDIAGRRVRPEWWVKTNADGLTGSSRRCGPRDETRGRRATADSRYIGRRSRA